MEPLLPAPDARMLALFAINALIANALVDNWHWLGRDPGFRLRAGLSMFVGVFGWLAVFCYALLVVGWGAALLMGLALLAALLADD